MQEDTSVSTSRVKTSDAVVLVYSIADRSSFRAAREALADLQQQQQQQSIDDTNQTENTNNSDGNRNRKDSQTTQNHNQRNAPIVLLGNKKDLAHLRQVCIIIIFYSINCSAEPHQTVKVLSINQGLSADVTKHQNRNAATVVKRQDK